MPSFMLHDQIPHPLLFPSQPPFCLPSRVFGCACFVDILTHSQDKLSAKATKCAFLGYSRLQRGYRCYSPYTRRYFVSTNVTFFEDFSFFFSVERLHNSDVLSFPLIYPSPTLSFPSPVAQPRPLQVYTYRPCIVVEPLANLSHMLSSSMTSVLPSTDFLPITLQKGTCSSRNPHPIYNLLRYHYLSSPYFAS